MSLLVFDGSEMIRYNPSTASIEASVGLNEGNRIIKFKI